jgi:hypothetical protein
MPQAGRSISQPFVNGFGTLQQAVISGVVMAN